MKKRVISGSLAVVFLIGILIFGIVHTVSASGKPEHAKYVTSITIEYGDSLWSIAEEYISEGYDDIPSFIEEIKSCNRLYEDEIHAGECLIVPYYIKPEAGGF